MDSSTGDFDTRVLQDVPIGICAFDRNDNFIQFNKMMEVISGMSYGSVIGRNIFDTLQEYTTGRQANISQFYLETKHSLGPSTRNGMMVYLPKKGLCYQTITFVPLLDKKGCFDGMICYVEDVGDRCPLDKAAINDLSKVYGFDSVCNKVPFVLFTWSSKNRWPVMSVSNNICIFGYTKEELESSDMSYMDIIHPDDRERVSEAVSKFTDADDGNCFSYEYRIIKKTGECCWVNELSWQARDEKGELSRFEGAIIDINEKKRREHELLQYAAELEQLNSLKDLFSDIIKHDLLTPAGAIKGYTELLLERENDATMLQLLNLIKTSTKQLIDLIENASRYEKLGSTKEIEYYYIDLVDMCRSTLLDFSHYSKKKNLTMNLSAPGPCHSLVNPFVREVFANLLSNAIKYSPENESIDVVFKDCGDYFEITVTDRGDGIPDESKTAVFDRLRRLDKKGVKGTGLGLAIVKRIMELHGGNYGVEDNPEGKGSVFWVTFNKARDPEQA